MASPLSPATNAMNIATSPTTRRFESSYDVKAYTTHILEENVLSAGGDAADGSSPFVDLKENTSPSKARHTRILSGTEIAPLRILSPRDEPSEDSQASPTKENMPPKSPRKTMSPERRFPVKIASSATAPQLSNPPAQAQVIQERDISLAEALRENEDLEKAIEIFEDESTMLENAGNETEDASIIVDHPEPEEAHECELAGPDDTMVSTFSTFSAVPNMTMFARIGHSPTKFANMDMTSTKRARADPSPSRDPRVASLRDSTNSVSLLDFTEQLSNFTSRGATSPNRRSRLSPGKTAQTPQRSPQANLLDFDIPPLPTPRSVPTISARELESLKSTFLSEISSLKASLLGKEAEVSSLKTAVGDAEKRVGECMEELREVRALKDVFAEEKEGWEKRGREMESVLRKVKQEIVLGQREKEELESKLDESEKRREAAEIMAQEAESKMAGMRAGKAAGDASASNSSKSPEKGPKSPGSREVEIAVERVARELHALYKSKHETKVSALKKSYENRWEKRVRELEAKIEELTDENEKIRMGRDATMTKVEPGAAAVEEQRREQAAKNSAQIKELTAEVDKLEASMKSVKQDNDELIQLLEKERVEKGELVQLAEEMMSMQHSFIAPSAEETSAASVASAATRTPAPRATTKETPASQQIRGSISRPGASALRAPAGASSRIGGVAHERTKSSNGLQGGLPRPGSGLGPGRSGIMSSIEKMGSYRGRGD